MASTTLFRRGLLSVIDNRCEVGPADQPFVERHEDFSVSYVRKGSFGYRARGKSFELVAGSVLIGHPGDESTCARTTTPMATNACPSSSRRSWSRPLATGPRSGGPAACRRLLSRVLDEGYGPGAWHGSDLKAALADVPADLAFWRPAPGRHNIAEIALHHAFYVRSVRGQLSGTTPEPFVLEGEDWFDPAGLSWPEIQAVVEAEQGRLAAAVTNVQPDSERFNLVLGITCHAIYHAGQVQLIKRLHGG